MDAAIVIVERSLGLFVGESNGRALWSRIDAEGEACVVTFDSEQDARLRLQRLHGADPLACYRFVTVYPDTEDGYASIRALIRAGLFFELGTLVPAGSDPAGALPDGLPAEEGPPVADQDCSSDRS
jgi:hypothetical protein